MRFRINRLRMISVVVVPVIALSWYCSGYFVAPPSSGDPLSTTVETGRSGRLHLGVLPAAIRVPFKFNLRNTTTVDHKIKRVDVSCGCLRVDEAPSIVPANGSTVVGLSMDTSTRRGLMVQHAIVTTDASDPERTLYRLRVSASIQGGWSDPASIEAGTAVADSETRVRYNIRCLGYERVRILGLRSTSNSIVAEIAGKMTTVRYSSSPGDVEYTQPIDLCVKPVGEARSLGAIVVADVDADGRALAIRTHVAFSVAGAISCEPNAIMCVMGSRDRVSREVRLKHQGDHPPEYGKLKLECSLEGVEARVDSFGSDGAVLHIVFSRLAIPSDATVSSGSIFGKIDSQILFKVPFTIIDTRQQGK